MSDQTPPDPMASINEQGSVDISARLASLQAPRTGVTSIWGRRDAAGTSTAPAAERPEGEPAGGETGLVPAPRAPSEATTSGGIGRLTRVSAGELWADAGAMAAWIAANGDALAELLGLEGLRFQAPTGGSVVGATSDGATVSVVCEVGPSSDEGLGALLRIAAVQDGGTLVWLNAGPSDPHVAALSWLNRTASARCFLAKATGVRIGTSASAPLFDLLVRPPRAAGTEAPAADAPQRRVGDHVPEA